MVVSRLFVIFLIICIFCLIFVTSMPLIPVDPLNQNFVHNVLPISEPNNRIPDDHIGLNSVDDVIVKHI